MHFTYDSYFNLVSLIKTEGYRLSVYDDESSYKYNVIMRHDVDYCLEKALTMAKKEFTREIRSTYFVMLTNDFYNVFSYHGSQILSEVIRMGHEIGLHFDEQRYPHNTGVPDRIIPQILEEAEILSHVTGRPVTKVSMHRPSKEIIKANLEIPGMVNTYGDYYINEYKYLSDSRRRWREPIEDMIRSHSYNRFQILIHPFWYNDKETEISRSLSDFVNSANWSRYNSLLDNFSDLGNVLSVDEVDGVKV